MSQKRIRVKQTRSIIGHPECQRQTLKSLGLGRIGKKREHVVSSSLVGMLKKVSHLIVVESI